MAQADRRHRGPDIADEYVEEIATTRGAGVALLVDPVENPKRVVVLFPGGGGAMKIDSSGLHAQFNNFVVRTRSLWRAYGVVAVAMDAPSDHKSDLADFRTDSAHAADIADVVRHLKAKFNVPVWLIGTSRGTVSVANAAERLPAGLIDGAIFTSGVTGRSRNAAGTMLDADWSKITTPVLFAGHRDDACAVSPLSGMRRIAEGVVAPRVIGFLTFEGGGPPESQACEPLSPHGFFGLEAQVIDALAAKILGPSKILGP